MRAILRSSYNGRQITRVVSWNRILTCSPRACSGSARAEPRPRPRATRIARAFVYFSHLRSYCFTHVRQVLRQVVAEARAAVLRCADGEADRRARGDRAAAGV